MSVKMSIWPKSGTLNNFSAVSSDLGISSQSHCKWTPGDISPILSYRLKAMQSVLGAIEISAKRKKEATISPHIQFRCTGPKSIHSFCIYVLTLQLHTAQELNKINGSRMPAPGSIPKGPSQERKPPRSGFLKIWISRPHGQILIQWLRMTFQVVLRQGCVQKITGLLGTLSLKISSQKRIQESLQ